MISLFDSFHFLRPGWLLALPLLALLLWWLGRTNARRGSWQAVVDPALLPHLLVGETVRQRRRPLLLLGLAGLLAITAMAGPAWQRVEQPLFRQNSSLVILLDLSRSMDAADLRPSRLARARLKLIDILDRRREGETALIAYAANAFVVTPLSDDSDTIAAQLKGMSTELMPAQGSRPDLAIARGRQLLQQAGSADGAVLLVSDGLDGADETLLDEQIGKLRSAGYKLLLLGVGGDEGAPIPLPGGGFVKDGEGNIVLAALDAAAMARAAHRGGGLYRPLSSDDSDIEALLSNLDEGAATKEEADGGLHSAQWHDEGVWLLPLLLLLVLPAFRRGVLWLALLAVLPLPQDGYALELDSLWLNQDQQGQQAFERGDHGAAAQLFEQREWQAAAHYRNGDYEKSLQLLQGLPGGEAAYNRGNALAKTGKLPQALEAYEEAIKQQPEMEDALFNRDLIKSLLQQQQGEGQQDKQGEKQQQDQSGDTPQQGEGGESSEQGQASSEEGDQGEQKGESEGQSEGEQQAAERLREQLQDEAPAESPSGDDQAPMPSAEELEREQSTEQWLRRIPDDPAGLWRRKFLYQYQNQQQKGEEDKPW